MAGGEEVPSIQRSMTLFQNPGLKNSSQVCLVHNLSKCLLPLQELDVSDDPLMSSPP